MRLAFALAGAALAVAGCQLILSTDRVQCSVDADCTRSAGSGFVCASQVCVVAASPAQADASGDGATPPDDSPWGCLANPPPRAAEDRSRTVALRQRYLVYSLSDCQHNRPIPGTELKLCSQRDVTCGSPVEVATTDCAGYANFKSAYRGFEGFVLVTPPRPTAVDGGASVWPETTTRCFREQAAREAAEGKASARCAVQVDGQGNPVIPIPDDLVAGLSPIVPPPESGDDPATVIPEAEAAHLMSTGTLRSLLGVTGKQFDAKGGHLLALALDCRGKPAAGVNITVSGGIGQSSQLYYTDTQGLPNINQGETSDLGETGYLNLEPGPTGIGVVTVTASRVATGQRLGVYAALTRAGYITYLAMPPLRN